MSGRILLIASIALLFVGCSERKEIVSFDEPEYFIIGSGGGFTGKYTEFRVYDDGLIEQMDYDENEYVQYAKVEAYQIHPFFSEITRLDLINVRYDNPGNMTWYFEVHDEEATNRVRWGDFKVQPIDPEIEEFYKKVNDFVLDQR